MDRKYTPPPGVVVLEDREAGGPFGIGLDEGVTPEQRPRWGGEGSLANS